MKGIDGTHALLKKDRAHLCDKRKKLFAKNELAQRELALAYAAQPRVYAYVN